MKALTGIGFTAVGKWRVAAGNLELSLQKFADASPALYAFVIGHEVMYVGKTRRTLKSRLYGYLKAGGTQRTNIRVRQKIIEALVGVDSVQILGFYEEQPKTLGGFTLNLPAALEDDIISTLKPLWNGGGRENSRAVQPENGGAMKPTFFVTIGKTYFNQGFFNVSVDFERYFAEHGTPIKIELAKSKHSIIGRINRTVNSNGTPRIMGRVELRDWIQSHVRFGTQLRVVVVAPDKIVIFTA